MNVTKLDDAADAALARRLTTWWGRLHLAVKAALVIVPVLVTAGVALASVDGLADSLDRVEESAIDVSARVLRLEVQVEALRQLERLPLQVERVEGKLDILIQALKRDR